MRRTKASLIHRRTQNLRAVQLLIGHTTLRVQFKIWASKSTTRSRWPKSDRLLFSQERAVGLVTYIVNNRCPRSVVRRFVRRVIERHVQPLNVGTSGNFLHG
jgi:hypothetical protein